MRMKEIDIVKTEQASVPYYVDKFALAYGQEIETEFMEYPGDIVKCEFREEVYHIKKFCALINNTIVTKRYVITDSFLEMIVNEKDRKWKHLAEMNNKLTHSANRLQEKADEDRKLYSYILAHPFKYALRRLFKLDAPEGSIG